MFARNFHDPKTGSHDLNTVCNTYSRNHTHNDLLFCTQLCIGFFALMCLGELTWPDNMELWDPRKLTKQNSITVNLTSFQFFLPGHKANRFFEGNTIILCPNPFPCNPMTLFMAYLESCDHLFPLSSPLWLNENGAVPTRLFFIWRLRVFFDSDVGGQSMRAGGVTKRSSSTHHPGDWVMGITSMANLHL